MSNTNSTNYFNKSIKQIANDTPSSVVKILSVEEVVKYEEFKVPQLFKDLTPVEFNNKLQYTKQSGDRHVPIFQPAKTLQHPNAVSKGFIYLQAFSRSPADRNMFIRMYKANLQEYTQESLHLVRTNGTYTGLANRIRERLRVPSKAKVYWGADQLKYSVAKLPLKISKEQFEEDLHEESPAFDSLNPKSAAGLPYAFEMKNNVMPKTEDDTFLSLDYVKYDPQTKKQVNVPLEKKSMKIVVHALNVAQQMWSVLKSAGDAGEATKLLTDFLLKRPELNTYLLKRKDERLERSDFLKKVRPYYVVPLPTRLLITWVMKFVETSLVPFWEDSNSISAYHFSPFYGGGEKMMNHYKALVARKDRLMTGLAYGDDNLMVFKFIEGDKTKLIFIGPDVVSMDMSTDSSCIAPIYEWLLAQGKEIPEKIRQAIFPCLSLSFYHLVQLAGPFVVKKRTGLSSGVTLTTVINIVNSCRIQYQFEEKAQQMLAKGDWNVENFFKFLGRTCSHIKDTLGYTFKGWEGLSLDAQNKTNEELFKQHADIVHVTDPETLEREGMPLSFLKLKLKVIDGKPMCVPDNNLKWGNSLIVPGTNGAKGVADPKYQCERILGVYMSGAHFDDKLGPFLQELYLEKIKEVAEGDECLPTEVNEMAGGDIRDLLLTEGGRMKFPKQLPSRKMMLKMQVLTKEEFHAQKVEEKQEVGKEESEEDDIGPLDILKIVSSKDVTEEEREIGDDTGEEDDELMKILALTRQHASDQKVIDEKSTSSAVVAPPPVPRRLAKKVIARLTDRSWLKDSDYDQNGKIGTPQLTKAWWVNKAPVLPPVPEKVAQPRQEPPPLPPFPPHLLKAPKPVNFHDHMTIVQPELESLQTTNLSMMGGDTVPRSSQGKPNAKTDLEIIAKNEIIKRRHERRMANKLIEDDKYMTAKMKKALRNMVDSDDFDTDTFHTMVEGALGDDGEEELSAYEQEMRDFDENFEAFQQSEYDDYDVYLDFSANKEYEKMEEIFNLGDAYDNGRD